MTEHQVKCWPPGFRDVADNRKTFEVRFNDRRYRVGDILVLNEYQPTEAECRAGRGVQGHVGRYTGRSLRRRIVYILDPLPGVHPDCGLVSHHVVLGLEQAP